MVCPICKNKNYVAYQNCTVCDFDGSGYNPLYMSEPTLKYRGKVSEKKI